MSPNTAVNDAYDNCNDSTIIRADVVIIGAGASGLQASRQLLTKDPSCKVVILEGRDRIGGRIHSTPVTIGDGKSSRQIVHDEGAAWVHGIGYDWPDDAGAASSTGVEKEKDVKKRHSQPHQPNSTYTSENPMVSLLGEVVGEEHKHLLFRESGDTKMVRLDPVFRHGNAWMRPKTSLVDANELAIYYDGQRMDACLDNGDTSTAETTDIASKTGISNAAKTANNASHAKMQKKNIRLVQQSLRRHWQLLDEVDDIGREMQETGRDDICIHQSLQETLERVISKKYSQDYAKRIQKSMKVSKGDVAFMEACRQYYLHLIELWYAGPTEQLQLNEFTIDVDENEIVALDKHSCDAAYTGEGDYYGPHCTVSSGMKTILDPLMGHGEEIRMNQTVVSIRQSGPITEDDDHRTNNHSSNNTTNNNISDCKVLITTRQGLQVHAKACIVTVPLACLKDHIQANSDASDDETIQHTASSNSSSIPFFQPPISAEKQAAIKQLRVGSYKKVVLTFDRIFWAARPAFIALMLSQNQDKKGEKVEDPENDSSWQSPLGQHLQIDNLWARDGIPMMEVVLIASSAEWAFKKSTDDIRDAVLQYLQKALDEPKVFEWCTNCHVTRWEEEEHSKGAYSTFGIGCSSELHTVALRSLEWGGCLAFAGEHTVSTFEGSVHAALISGKSAADSLRL